MDTNNHKNNAGQGLSSNPFLDPQQVDTERTASAPLVDSPAPAQPDWKLQDDSADEDGYFKGKPASPARRQHSPGSGMSRGSPEPRIPRHSSQKHLSQKYGGITKSKTGVLTPQASASARWNAIRGKNVAANESRIPYSKTAPLNASLVGDQDPHPDPFVTKKTKAMLAHTEALKPSKRNSRVARMSAKVALKASSTWGRLTGKKEAPKESIRGKISGPLELKQTHVRRDSTIRMVDSHSEMIKQDLSNTRGNEYDKEASGPHTPTKGNAGGVWTQIVPDSVHSSDGSNDSDDPFEGGHDFTGGLDGVLADGPVAASTPRVNRSMSTTMQESPLYQRSMAANGHQEDLLGPLGQSQRVMGFPALSAVASSYLQLPRPDVMHKKHPSPSKAELDEMAKKLQNVGIRPASYTNDHDELANSYQESPWPVRVSGQTPRGVSEERRMALASLTNSVGRTPASVRARSAIPGPTGSTRSNTRYGLIRMPLGPDALDEDELA